MLLPLLPTLFEDVWPFKRVGTKQMSTYLPSPTVCPSESEVCNQCSVLTFEAIHPHKCRNGKLMNKNKAQDRVLWFDLSHKF